MPLENLLKQIEKIEVTVKDNRQESAKKADDFEKRIEQTVRDFTSETRERLQRADGEREEVKKLTKTEFGEINRKLDRITSLAEATNGRVNIHEDELFGGKNSKGIKAETRSLLDSRTYITVLLGFLTTLGVIFWAVYGGEISARGLLNKTEAEEVQLIEREIWKHK